MGIFKSEADTKRVIFNVRSDLASRLEKAKEHAKVFGKKLDVDGAVDKAIEKFLKKAEKKLDEMHKDGKSLESEATDSEVDEVLENQSE